MKKIISVAYMLTCFSSPETISTLRNAFLEQSQDHSSDTIRQTTVEEIRTALNTALSPIMQIKAVLENETTQKRDENIDILLALPTQQETTDLIGNLTNQLRLESGGQVLSASDGILTQEDVTRYVQEDDEEEKEEFQSLSSIEEKRDYLCDTAIPGYIFTCRLLWNLYHISYSNSKLRFPLEFTVKKYDECFSYLAIYDNRIESLKSDISY